MRSFILSTTNLSAFQTEALKQHATQRYFPVAIYQNNCQEIQKTKQNNCQEIQKTKQLNAEFCPAIE